MKKTRKIRVNDIFPGQMFDFRNKPGTLSGLYGLCISALPFFNEDDEVHFLVYVMSERGNVHQISFHPKDCAWVW